MGNHTDLPVDFVTSVEDVIPTLQRKLAALPQAKLDQPVDARL
jgi:hypothetical protein